MTASEQANKGSTDNDGENSLPPLSKREVEILRLLKQGKSSYDIGVILFISKSTVKYHIANALGKLNASNRTHAVAIAIEQKLI
ncbi:response regulator transcription factor [Kaarinaea lacus]